MKPFSTTTLFLILLFMTSLTTQAQVRISADVDRTVITVDEQINLTLNINAEARSISDPQVPAIEGFEIYSSGSSQSFNMINGKFSTSVSFSYILTPNKTGVLTIPPFSVRVKGVEYNSNSIQVTVNASGQQPPKSSVPPSRGSRPAQKAAGQKVFITAELDKKSAFVNEQVTLTFKFYQAIRLLGNPELQKPDFEGFWIEDLPPQNKYYEQIGGTKYYVVEIKTALFPTSAGTKTIEPFKIAITPDEFTSLFGRDPFDMFNSNFFGRRQAEPQVLYTDRLTLDVKPLPLEGKPANYSGAVGQFTLRASPDIIDTEVNDPINFTITISGTGNIKAVDKPSLNVPVEFRSYPSNTSERISKDNYRLGGSRTFEEVLIPKSPGTFELAPFRFSFFDLAKKGYITLASESYTFHVKPSSVAGTVSEAPSAVQNIGSSIKDLRYLKTELSPGHSRMKLYNKPLFWGVQVLPVLMAIAAFVVRKQKDKLESDIAYARSRRARAISGKVLKSAIGHLQRNESPQFYGAVHKALTGYLADKLSLSAAGLTNELLRDSLIGKVDDAVLQETFQILQACDFHRFASAAGNDRDGKGFLDRVGRNIIMLEKSL